MKPRPNIMRARSLRKMPNAPEQKAWETLRALRDQGFAVRRQHPVGRYIVDFAITKAKLAIEVDGGIHNLPEVSARDIIRETEIVKLGWRVLRVPTEVAMSTDHLLGLVQKELGL